jgi:antitoxin component YwqK of YwqJK toxin-antitoxin module
MKTLVAFISLLLLAQMAKAQTAIARDLPTALGAIKSVRSETYKLTNKAGKLVEGEKLWLEVIEYSRDKSKVLRLVYRLDGSLSDRVVYSFGAESRLTSIDYYDEKGVLTGNDAYKYGPNGRRREAAYYLEGLLSFRDVYNFNALGDRAEIESRFPPDDQMSGREIYLYDAGGRVSEATFYNPDGSLAFKEFYKYDGKGNPTEYTVFDSGGGIPSKERYEYKFDAQGNWLEKRILIWSTDAGKNQYDSVEIIRRAVSYY